MDSTIDNAIHQHRHEGSTYRRIELITGEARRRRWTDEEKAALVAESMKPDINVSALARLRGVSCGLLQTWRRAAMSCGGSGSADFVPIRLASESELPTPAMGMIEIEGSGLRVKVSGAVDIDALRAVLAHVGRRR